MTFRLTALADPAAGPSSHRLAWLASAPDGTPLGSAFLRLFDSPGQAHLCELALDVHPAERRRGAGSALLEAAATTAREDGRRTLLAQAVEGSPGDAFLCARGFERALVLEYARLDLTPADTGTTADATEAGGMAGPRLPPGYRLVSWLGSCPEEWLSAFTRARTAMDDMPMGDTDFGVVAWDEARVLAAARAVADRGELLHTAAVLETATGDLVGFSELVLPADRSGDGQHYGTAVQPAHRRRGLARAMKAEAIRWVRAEHPGITGLRTDTADHNTGMLAVNHALGYRSTHRSVEFRLPL
ncbi:acetyltransferase (GNAT) family protein [Kitasatospora sp. SolWspMP-SS2h]|uniref:GNAT family N-acetyltransferase n=1 Tax=Kitasatospora sp. SolWspMP-SS2h TaxID=1305729 RepID=UPI000DBA47D8|nr:GNAT family N-acetyltransferase [Kitasatospora sp. SolWspMP-SS2h]RAJ36892.1 acetyltransferase (GNAT) family protein [Kitasatospora sp. SolWspMP-SS2h]